MGSVLEIFRVIREERLAFWIFLGVNLGFGGMAIWLPPVVATQHPSANPLHELLTALEQGHGYIFGLALLAAAASYWLRDYLDNKETDFKVLKLSATLLSFVIMVLMALFLGIMIYQGFISQNCLGNCEAKTTIWSPLITQILFTVFALVMATYLFCLERLDNHPDVGKGLKDKTTKRIAAGMDDTSSTGIKT